MPDAAVTQPVPAPFSKAGTRSSTVAVHSTGVSPNCARHEPSAYLLTSTSRVTVRRALNARPDGRAASDMGRLSFGQEVRRKLSWRRGAVHPGPPVRRRRGPRPPEADRKSTRLNSRHHCASRLTTLTYTKKKT